MRFLKFSFAFMLILTQFMFASFAQDSKDQTGGTITVIGTVKHFSFEGGPEGAYGIVDPDGKQYTPDTFPEEFQLDGLKVKAVLRPPKKKLLLKPWSVPCELISIERYEPEK